jgi:hypothetical protein
MKNPKINFLDGVFIVFTPALTETEGKNSFGLANGDVWMSEWIQRM